MLIFDRYRLRYDDIALARGKSATVRNLLPIETRPTIVDSTGFIDQRRIAFATASR